jgi:S1-C subfamily serine protease
VRVVYATAKELVGGTEELEFVKVVEEKDPHASGQASGGFGAYFGSIPDYGAQENGVKLSGVRENSPAAKAGVQGGDVIIRFGGREIADIYDYTDALRSHRPGDTVDILVLRGGQEVALKATLGTRE